MKFYETIGLRLNLIGVKQKSKFCLIKDPQNEFQMKLDHSVLRGRWFDPSWAHAQGSRKTAFFLITRSHTHT